jgi:cytochrome c553
MIWVQRAVRVGLFLVLLALAILYGGSSFLFSRHVSMDLPKIEAATDPADIAEGERLSRILGCQTCHGEGGRGKAMYDDFAIGRIVAPALVRVYQGATDGQIARAIRNGVGTDSRALYVMPTEAMNHLSDRDVARLIGWIHSLQPTMNDLVGKKQVGPVGRLGVLIGKFPSSVNAQGGQPRERPAEIGAYFTTVSCGQCHAPDHDRPAGTGDLVAPALAPLAAAYDPDAFKTLLRTGKAAGDRELPMMSEAARTGLSALSDAEIAAIQEWLKSQAGAPALY